MGYSLWGCKELAVTEHQLQKTICPSLHLPPTGEKGGCSVAHVGNGVWEGLHVEEMEQLSFGTLFVPPAIMTLLKSCLYCRS